MEVFKTLVRAIEPGDASGVEARRGAAIKAGALTSTYGERKVERWLDGVAANDPRVWAEILLGARKHGSVEACQQLHTLSPFSGKLMFFGHGDVIEGFVDELRKHGLQLGQDSSSRAFRNRDVIYLLPPELLCQIEVVWKDAPTANEALIEMPGKSRE